LVAVRLDGAETVTDRDRRKLLLLCAQPEVTITYSRYAGGEAGPDLHVHRGHTDAFYVLAGEMTFTVGPDQERTAVGAGGFVAVPPGVVHTYALAGSAGAQWLNFHAVDGGFAAYLRGLRDGAEVAWDSFDPPADGGRPADEAVVSPPGAGESLREEGRDGLLRGALPLLRVAEWPLDGSYEGPQVQRAGDVVHARFALDGRLLHVRAPGSA
jgi:quercetin dioxygenase-like cupin family protein